MLLPARVKYRKLHRGRRTGVATQGNDLAFGEFGLQASEAAWMTNRQIEGPAELKPGEVAEGGIPGAIAGVPAVAAGAAAKGPKAAPGAAPSIKAAPGAAPKAAPGAAPKAAAAAPAKPAKGGGKK